MAIVHTVVLGGVNYSFDQQEALPAEMTGGVTGAPDALGSQAARIRIVADDGSSPGAFDLVDTTSGWRSFPLEDCADASVTFDLGAAFAAAVADGTVRLR